MHASSRLQVPVSALFAALLMASFFTVLRASISVDLAATALLPIDRIQFVPMKPPVAIEPPPRVKPKPVKPEPQLTMPLPQPKEHGNPGPDVKEFKDGLDREFGVPGGRSGGGDGEHGLPALRDQEALALVRVDPAYPPQATRRGLEGWVHVRFTVTSAGTLENVVVVKSSHSMFERAAVAAASRWRYQPARRDGKPVATELETVIRFQMDRNKG